MNADWGSQAMEATEKTVRAPSSLDFIDDELERLEKTVSILSARLVHVSIQPEEKDTGHPVAAPRSPLASRAQRIGDVCSTVETLINRLDI